MKSEDDADDALQDLFLKTWRDSRDSSGAADNKAYLFSALRNICIDLLRKRRDNMVPEDVADSFSPHSRTEDADTIDHIRRIVEAKLTGMPRQVFEMYVFCELDYDEIAVILETTPEAVRTAMSRARKVIRTFCKYPQ